MKRIIAVLCIVLALGMMMSACGESSSSNKGGAGTQVDVSLQKIFDEVKEEVDFPEMVEYTSADQLDRRYGISEDMIDDYAGGIEAASVTTNEIVLVRAMDDAAADEIEEKLQKRLEVLLNQSRNYLPEQAAVIEKCKVERNDRLISLIISPDAEKITESYHKHFI